MSYRNSVRQSCRGGIKGQRWLFPVNYNPSFHTALTRLLVMSCEQVQLNLRLAGGGLLSAGRCRKTASYTNVCVCVCIYSELPSSFAMYAFVLLGLRSNFGEKLYPDDVAGENGHVRKIYEIKKDFLMLMGLSFLYIYTLKVHSMNDVGYIMMMMTLRTWKLMGNMCCNTTLYTRQFYTQDLSSCPFIYCGYWIRQCETCDRWNLYNYIVYIICI